MKTVSDEAIRLHSFLVRCKLIGAWGMAQVLQELLDRELAKDGRPRTEKTG